LLDVVEMWLKRLKLPSKELLWAPLLINDLSKIELTDLGT
jgi:hypothetical protein